VLWIDLEKLHATETTVVHVVTNQIEGRIQCRANLFHKRIVDNPGCEICRVTEETAGHIVFQCLFAVAFCYTLVLSLQRARMPKKQKQVCSLLDDWFNSLRCNSQIYLCKQTAIWPGLQLSLNIYRWTLKKHLETFYDQLHADFHVCIRTGCCSCPPNNMITSWVRHRDFSYFIALLPTQFSNWYPKNSKFKKPDNMFFFQKKKKHQILRITQV